MRPERAPAQRAYDAAAGAIAARLDDGQSVAVLCEGDPYYYGSFMYLDQRLGAQFEVEIVPGITSLTAAAAQLGRPLAARRDRLKVLPAMLARDVLRKELSGTEAAAIIKIGRYFDTVREVLDELQLSDRAYVVSHATLPQQQIDRLDRLPAGESRYFSTILVYAGDEPFHRERQS